MAPAPDDAPALSWAESAQLPALQARLPGLTLQVLASVDSTNARLLDELQRAATADPGAPQPRLLVAERQTAGRGRHGRSWASAPGASLTFSLALPLAARSWSGLSLAVGAALADALEPPAPDGALRIGLKWPNDLWLLDAPGRGRKLGGVLIETVTAGGGRVAVIGVGLNLRPLPAPQRFDTGYASLDECLPAIDAPGALWRVALPLVDALRRFERDGFAPFIAAWRRRDLLFGQPVRTTDPAAALGVADGIDADGALYVRVGGVRHAIVGGEVSVRRAGA